MRMLARRNANPMRFQRATDGRVSKDIVRRRRLLNEPKPSAVSQLSFLRTVTKPSTLGAEDRMN